MSRGEMRQVTIDAILWARSMIEHPDVRFLDTETTGIDARAEVVDLTILDREGRMLFDSLIRPRGAIPARASDVHGITDRSVANAPTWPDVYPAIRDALGAGGPIVIYNVEFDVRLIQQTNRIWKMPPMAYPWHCAMERFAQFRGEWNSYRQSYRWAKLVEAIRYMGLTPDPGAHRALADTLMTLALVQAMANTSLPGESGRFRQQSFLGEPAPYRPRTSGQVLIEDPTMVLEDRSSDVLDAVADRLRGGESIDQIISRIRTSD